MSASSKTQPYKPYGRTPRSNFGSCHGMLTVHQAWRKSHLFPHWVLDFLALALAPEETQMCQLVSQNKLPPNSVARNSKALSSCGFLWAGIWGRLCRFDVRSLRRDPRFGFSFPPVQWTPFRTQSKNLSQARLHHFLSHTLAILLTTPGHFLF